MSSVKLEKKDVRGAFFRWWLMSHLTYNYQRMQGGAFCSSLGPVLAKLYPDNKEKLIEGLKRHLIFFNTSPIFGAIIPGMAVALEEKYAQEPDMIDPETITDLKSSLMGPFAGIGDTITQSLLNQIVLSIALGWTSKGNLFGIFFFSAIMFSHDILITHYMFMKGYTLGIDAAEKFMDQEFLNKLTTGLGILGLFVLGAMICKFVSVDLIAKLTMKDGTTIDFANMLNQLVPKIIPLGFTLFAWRLLQKGKSSTFVLLLLFIIAFVFGALGILG